MVLFIFFVCGFCFEVSKSSLLIVFKDVLFISIKDISLYILFGFEWDRVYCWVKFVFIFYKIVKID